MQGKEGGQTFCLLACLPAYLTAYFLAPLRVRPFTHTPEFFSEPKF